MGGNLVSLLISELQFAFIGAVQGLVIAVLWAPFLFAKHWRRLFSSLPPTEWQINYLFWMPLPAIVWYLIFGIALRVGLNTGSSTSSSVMFTAGVNAIVGATVVSLLLWPILLLYVLPAKGFNWHGDEHTPTTVVLVLSGLLWYLLVLTIPVGLLVFFGSLPTH